MENIDAIDVALAVYGAPRRGGGDDAGLLGLLQPRGRRFRAAAYFAAWGVAGVVSATVPNGLAANPDHVMIYFVLLMAGVLLVLFAVAAPDCPAAERASARLEGRLMAML